MPFTLFFDIDGTLIDAGGAGSQAMTRALATEFKVPADSSKIVFAGRTDRSLIGQHLSLHDIEVTDQSFERYRNRFLELLPETLAERDGCLLPNVVNVLDQLTVRDDVRLGLITGNMRAAAKMKLDHYGVASYFYPDVIGGFGDDHPDRDDVARVAMAELQQVSEEAIDPNQVWVIGDTPNDIQCARAIGAKVVAVETGRHDRDRLAACDPDLILRDLNDVDEWFALL